MEYLIKTNSIGGMSEEQFFHFCQENDTLKMEKNSNGEILIMAPTGFETEEYNFNLARVIAAWNDEAKLGHVVGNNAGFVLANGAIRSPDVAFLSNQRMSKISKQDRKKFIHICPDFVIELRSESDNLLHLKDKMKEWISNGCQLAWLIDPSKKCTIVYRHNQSIESLPFSHLLTGENILPGLSIDLNKIFIE